MNGTPAEHALHTQNYKPEAFAHLYHSTTVAMRFTRILVTSVSATHSSGNTDYFRPTWLAWAVFLPFKILGSSIIICYLLFPRERSSYVCNATR